MLKAKTMYEKDTCKYISCKYILTEYVKIKLDSNFMYILIFKINK